METSPLARPLRLPCGLTLPNRLVKAAMAEQMADCHQLPTAAQFDRTYGGWADGGWGMIVTGYVQVDGRYLGSPDDLAIDATRGLSEDKVVAAYKKLATVSRRAGTPSIIQINHVGRQSPVGAGTHRPWSKTLAPSAIPLDLGSDFMSRLLVGLIFGIPKEMTIAEIEDIVQRFANAARIAAKAGFDGVQIHAAHGYLLAQFMSARSNHRTDAYGSSAAARAKIVLDIIKAVRAVVPKTFCVGLKLNSVDHQTSSGASSEMEDCLQQAALIAEASLDFIEVSGGSYENPLVSSPSKGGFWMHAVMLTRVDVYRSRESSYSVCKNGSPGILLLDFAREIRARIPDMPLIVTGGFETRQGMEAALDEACDMVGIARPSVLNPSLPANTILNKEVNQADAKMVRKRIPTPWLLKKLAPKPVGAGVESTWYSKEIRKMGN